MQLRMNPSVESTGGFVILTDDGWHSDRLPYSRLTTHHAPRTTYYAPRTSTTISLPKAEKAKAKEIAVKVG